MLNKCLLYFFSNTLWAFNTFNTDLIDFTHVTSKSYPVTIKCSSKEFKVVFFLTTLLFRWWIEYTISIQCFELNELRLKIRFFCVHKLAYCALQCRHNGRDGVSNHQLHDCLFNHILKVLIKENIKAPRSWLCAENSPVTGEFPAQRASNAENVSIWWRHHVHKIAYCVLFHLQHRLSFIFSTCRWQRISIWFIAFIVRTVTVLCLIVKSLQRIWPRVG